MAAVEKRRPIEAQGEQVAAFQKSKFLLSIGTRRIVILDLARGATQTENMAHIYMSFDFGTDEEKAQLARHKLEMWRQAFRLDKKLLYKFERTGPEAHSAAPVAAEKTVLSIGRSVPDLTASPPCFPRVANWVR